MHLIVDGHGGNYAKLQDLDLVFTFLDTLPGEINMTKIMPPYVFRYRGVKPEDWGVTGVVLIAESHIAVHTFPERGLINIDVFSCKEFDVETAAERIKETFELRMVERQVLARGLEYAEPLALAAER